ncbi:MAG: phenylalanine--tRNA ligase subunit beta [Erysipelotrichaceae bacterium]|nr:phenylalanine--tRNA ligase subunit beta [Erysipelotrichaceae bacterium]
MKVSLNWLSSLVDISGLSVEQIIDSVIKAGFEVEEVATLGYGTNLVVGKVIECHDHPDSDHLHVTKTDIGTEVLDIVCGAPNCREGLKVIVAQVGAKLMGGDIKASKIRGVASNGMLCSLLELNVKKEMLPENSPSHTGIEELGDEFEVGETDILKKLGYEDTILDLATYANRPDTISMYGMAKEIAAILDRPCKLPEFAGAANIGGPTKLTVNSESANCPHFLAKVVNSVKIKESPDWMKHHLISNGVKAINILVDISNYVMLETGQPMHFYDLRSNPNLNITVKDDMDVAYTALDGVEYNIQKGDMMITSDNQPIGIAGIMGGDNTKILDDTTGLIIECALFDYAQIRRTANRLGLQTEAAMRYAKGLDPLAQQKALDRAVQLLIEYADATGFEETVEYGKANYEPYTVSETLSHLNALIGKEYKMEEVVDVLRRLDFKPEVNGDEIISHIPSYRSTDIKIREDIDEEVVRLTDFNDLKTTLPYMKATVGKLTPRQALRRRIERMLVNASLNEVVNYTLVDQKYKDESLLPSGEAIALLSPLSDARKYLRTSLMNSLLENLAYNLDHSASDVNLFELSKIYTEGKVEERLGVLLYGNLEESKLLHQSVKADFYVLKGLIMEIFDRCGFDKARVQVTENTMDTVHYHPYQSCLVSIDRKFVGILGKIHPTYASKFKVKDVYYAEIMLDELDGLKAAKIKAPVLSKYPSISRDISIILKDEVKAEELLKVAKKAGGQLVKSVEVFDVYKGEHIEKGYKSVSISIVYENKEKTLKVEDIDVPHNKILEELNKHYGANQR